MPSGPCRNEPKVLDFANTPELEQIPQSEFEYGLCAACWLALEGKF